MARSQIHGQRGHLHYIVESLERTFAVYYNKRLRLCRASPSGISRPMGSSCLITEYLAKTTVNAQFLRTRTDKGSTGPKWMCGSPPWGTEGRKTIQRADSSPDPSAAVRGAAVLGEKEEPSGLMGSDWRLWWWDVQLSSASLFVFGFSSSRQR